MSKAPCSRLAGAVQVGQRLRFAGARPKGLRNGASASSVTIHGEVVLAKFFDRNGPSGWYSQAWTSRALQSLNSVSPKTWSSASSIAIGSPRAFGRPMKMPSSSS